MDYFLDFGKWNLGFYLCHSAFVSLTFSHTFKRDQRMGGNKQFPMLFQAEATLGETLSARGHVSKTYA